MPKPIPHKRSDRAKGQNAKIRQDRSTEPMFIFLWGKPYLLVPREDGPGFWTVQPKEVV